MELDGYTLETELGRGGMGVVYRARSPRGEAVAVKVLLAAADREALALFERETRLLRQLNETDGFVPVLDAGAAAGRPFLVMPLVPGGTLRDRLRRGPMKVDEALELARTLAAALGAAHERGIVHRDLKPANVLYTEEGRPLIADLGLAKHFRRDVLGASASVALSVTGTHVGSPGYAAPEQLSDASRAEPEADVFAVGAILFEALAGVKPFDGMGPTGYMESLRKPTPSLRARRKDVPAWLDSLVARTLARRPSERPRDGAELARLLAPPAAPRKGRGALVAGGLVVLAVAGGLGARTAWRHHARARALELARDAMARGDAQDWDRALDAARSALALDEACALAYTARARVKAARSDLEGALADNDRALALDATIASSWAGRAYEKMKLKDRRGALADATRAIELDPKFGKAWLYRALVRMELKDERAALEDAEHATRLMPDHADMWATEAKAALPLDRAHALRAVARALELDPDQREALALRGYLTEAGDAPAALKDYERILTKHPDYAYAATRHAIVRARVDPYGAIPELTARLAVLPRDAELWAARGAARLAQDDEGGGADLDRSIELDDREPWTLTVRGNLRASHRDFEGAIQDYDRAIAIGTPDPIVWFLRGRARKERGDRAGAIADLEKFLGTDPPSAEANEARRCLAELRAR